MGFYREVWMCYSARYGSTRLPGKPLADIAGKPMIEQVYARVSQATKTVCTIVATVDNRV